MAAVADFSFEIMIVGSCDIQVTALGELDRCSLARNERSYMRHDARIVVDTMRMFSGRSDSIESETGTDLATRLGRHEPRSYVCKRIEGTIKRNKVRST